MSQLFLKLNCSGVVRVCYIFFGRDTVHIFYTAFLLGVQSIYFLMQLSARIVADVDGQIEVTLS